MPTAVVKFTILPTYKENIQYYTKGISIKDAIEAGKDSEDTG